MNGYTPLLASFFSGIPVGVYVAGGAVLVVLIAAIGMYNGLVNLTQLCDESFSDIDAELQRRHDLVPNLVTIVKGYAKHEKELFEAVTITRSRAIAAMGQLSNSRRVGAARQPQVATAAQQALISEERALSNLMGRLLVVAEQYPKLQADQSFGQLMTEVRNTEDRIQAARRFFNANIRELNNRCLQFPSSLIAAMFKFKERDYFEVDNPLSRANVNIRFGPDAAP